MTSNETESVAPSEDGSAPDVVSPSADGQPRRPSRRRLLRRVAFGSLALFVCGMLTVIVALVALTAEYSGTPSRSAHGTGHDAEWLGHAWVDGRKSQSDVDALVARLRTTGIRDLFVHTGPYNNDGTLDPALRPRARWFIAAVHAALPGVRVQAWLGAHPVPDQLHLESPTTQAALLMSVGQVLDDGFDGVHENFEPLYDGDENLLTVLRATHALTQRRGALLSVSAVHGEPWPMVAGVLALSPRRIPLWSTGYLHRVASEVDQVAVMAYDTALPTMEMYGGYVRRMTEAALTAVPADVALFIGVSAYHDENMIHHRRAETVAAGLRGVRLALGEHPPRLDLGVALYVDFTATDDDWLSYDHDWAHLETTSP